MEISRQLAAQIVSAVYDVVGSDINLINASGVIIGSTNPKRIGSFHEAGFRAIQEKRPVFVNSRHQFKGTHEGINYPIFLEDSPIAVIGITGNPDELKQFGFLITKITEVFLKEQQLNEEMLSESRSLHYLITSLIYDHIQNPKQLEVLLKKYELEPEKEYAALSVKFQDAALEHSLRLYFSNIGCRLSLYLYPNEWAVIFDRIDFARFSPADFQKQYQNRLHAGLGPFGTLYQLGQSWQGALAARRHAKQLKIPFCSTEDISIGLILENIPAHIQKMYSEHMLAPLTPKELHILKTYFSCGLSLKAASEALFIHKNTLQYQLDRITEKCGLNPREFQDAFLLQFALLCM